MVCFFSPTDRLEIIRLEIQFVMTYLVIYKKKATTSDNQQQSDKQSTTNLSLSDNATTSTILSGPDHLISKSSVLGGTGDCTKIKFSSKGLTAQQLQLIEQLFKQSKKVANSSGNSTSTASEAAGSKAASTAIGKITTFFS